MAFVRDYEKWGLWVGRVWYSDKPNFRVVIEWDKDPNPPPGNLIWRKMFGVHIYFYWPMFGWIRAPGNITEQTWKIGCEWMWLPFAIHAYAGSRWRAYSPYRRHLNWYCFYRGDF